MIVPDPRVKLSTSRSISEAVRNHVSVIPLFTRTFPVIVNDESVDVGASLVQMRSTVTFHVPDIAQL